MAKDTSSSKLKVIDPRSPFYITSSDNPGIMLTNVVLRGETNYDNWAKAMKNALKAKNKLGFVTGTMTKPEDDTSDEGHAWVVCNSMINGSIHNTIDSQLQPFIQYFDAAKDLWDDLKESYYVENVLRIYQLKTTLMSLKQQGTKVGTYYTRLRAIWDELEASKTVHECLSKEQCPMSKYVNEKTEKDRVYQFLMGLDDATFGNLRTQILNSTPLPSINRVYAMVTQEGTHRSIARTQSEKVDAVGYAMQTNNHQIASLHQMVIEKTQERISCSHCGKIGHDVSKCWHLHGYPNKFAGKGRGKGKTGGGRTGAVVAHAA